MTEAKIIDISTPQKFVVWLATHDVRTGEVIARRQKRKRNSRYPSI